MIRLVILMSKQGDEMLHTFSGETISFEVMYKNRKSFAIYLDQYGNLEVHAPKGVSYEKVLRFLEDKWDVILRKVKEKKERWDGPKEKTYEQGESFLYLGNTYPIKITHDSNITQDQVVFEAGVLHIYVKQLDDERKKQALKRFYYQQCKALVVKRIGVHQRHFKTKPRSIQITDNQTNWGTCDAQQNLTFNWRLAMAPLDVIDYVVVHEMCHMVHLNHDRSFWRLVGKLMPEYEERENWLKLSNWKMVL